MGLLPWLQFWVASVWLFGNFGYQLAQNGFVCHLLGLHYIRCHSAKSRSSPLFSEAMSCFKNNSIFSGPGGWASYYILESETKRKAAETASASGDCSHSHHALLKFHNIFFGNYLVMYFKFPRSIIICNGNRIQFGSLEINVIPYSKWYNFIPSLDSLVLAMPKKVGTTSCQIVINIVGFHFFIIILARNLVPTYRAPMLH